MNFSKHILPNGVRAVLIPMAGTQTVLAQVLAGTGSHYETKGQNGISHFLEHILFKGTSKRPSSRIIAEEIDQVGGELNAFTDKEQTGYWARVAKQHWRLALDVTADLYLNPLLEQEEINRERGVILQEAAMYRDMPAAHVWDVFEKLLYGDQPAGRSIVGEEENIRNFQKKDFVDYLKNQYGPKNTVVAVAGNFSEKEVLGEIKKLFCESALEKRKKMNQKITGIKKFKPSQSAVFFPKKTDQAQFVLGGPASDMFGADRYAEKLLAIVLGGGMSSRLFLNIRERRGLCYHISAGTEQNLNSGYFHISAGVDPLKLPLTVELVLAELKEIKSKKVSLQELKKSKEYFKGKILMGLESPVGAASFFANQELFKNRIEKEKVLLDRIEKISASDLLRVANRIFDKKNLKLAVVTEKKQEQVFEKLLKTF